MNTGRALAYIAFLVLLTGSLLVSEIRPLTAADFADLPASAQAVTPLRTGDRAPAFTVLTVDGDAIEFDPSRFSRPAIFISFRGGWCPYCNMHLSELRTVVPRIADMGVDIYFLSGDRPELLHASLERETQADIAGLDYEILSDANMEAAMAFGTAFRVADKTVNWLNEKGKDFEGSSIQRHNALAVPAVYVVDANGRIAFDYVNPDYKIRLSADELLAVAQSLSAGAR